MEILEAASAGVSNYLKLIDFEINQIGICEEDNRIVFSDFKIKCKTKSGFFATYPPAHT